MEAVHSFEFVEKFCIIPFGLVVTNPLDLITEFPVPVTTLIARFEDLLNFVFFLAINDSGRGVQNVLARVGVLAGKVKA